MTWCGGYNTFQGILRSLGISSSLFLTVSTIRTDHPFISGSAREALGLDDEFLFVSLARHSLQKNTYGLGSGCLLA